MTDVSIQVQGVPQLVRKLGKAVATDTLARAMDKARMRVQSALQRYPSPPQGSTYVRTGDLGRSWTSRTIVGADGVTGQLGNAVRSRRGGRAYARYVQADVSEPAPHQTQQHTSTGWITDLQALERNRSAIERDFNDAIDKALS